VKTTTIKVYEDLIHKLQSFSAKCTDFERALKPIRHAATTNQNNMQLMFSITFFYHRIKFVTLLNSSSDSDVWYVKTFNWLTWVHPKKDIKVLEWVEKIRNLVDTLCWCPLQSLNKVAVFVWILQWTPTIMRTLIWSMNLVLSGNTNWDWSTCNFNSPGQPQKHHFSAKLLEQQCS
jgi:hypothetical protein